MYVYRAKLDRLIGPVSMSVAIDLGFRLELVVPVRLDGVTLPEKRREAQALTKEWLALRPEGFVLQSVQGHRQTFDRWFGVIMDDDGASLNQALLDSGLVKPYKSGEAEDE